MPISENSIKSLFIKTQSDEQDIGTGTGFLMEKNGVYFLITNRHIVTGRHNETNELLDENGRIPKCLSILHAKNTGSESIFQWIYKNEELYDIQGNPLWIEHPKLKEKADFVALRLKDLEDCKFFPYSFGGLGENISVGPAEVVSVVGFPLGLGSRGPMTTIGLALWVTGFIASELEIDYGGLPRFLIDCRTRPGQSGSPVIAYRSGGAIPRSGGGTIISGPPMSKLLGIYSGRINNESDLGFVWKVFAIKELIDSID